MKPIHSTDIKEFKLHLDVYFCSKSSFKKIVTGMDISEEEKKEVLTDLENAHSYMVAYDPVCIVWLSSNVKTAAEFLCNCVHECHHVSTHVVNSFQLDSEEFAAYFEGELVSTLFTKVKNRLAGG